MAQTATAPYYTYREWKDHESEAARRSAARARSRSKPRRVAKGRSRRVWVPALVLPVILLGLCGLGPVLLNTAALYTRASAAQMEREAEALRQETAQLVAEQARLAAAGRLEQVAAQMGLEPANAITYLALPAQLKDQMADQAVPRPAPEAPRLALGGKGSAWSGSDP